MLRKVLKKDMQATARYFLPLILGFLVISGLGKLLFELGLVSSSNNDFMTITALICLSFYILYLVAFYILTYVFLVADFYKTMVGEPGYLTHTLPVKTSTLLNSKVLISIVWQFVMSVLIFLSFVLFAAGHMTSPVWESITAFMPDFERELGMSFQQFIGFIFVCMVVGAIGSPLMFYVSIALGHLFGKHRIMGAILSYLGISSVTQIIATIALIAFGYTITKPMDLIQVSVASVDTSVASTSLAPMLTATMWFSIIFTLVTSIAFYMLTHYIFKKKLNLE